jgi:D-glycero-D-manno-heptose 1,7-bisphosphate phosphatase
MRILFEGGTSTTTTPAILIDRDGVINLRRPGDYVLDWSQFVFIPGIRKALAALSKLGLPLLVISNQAAVGKGLLTSPGLETITRRLHESLLMDGASINAFYYCVHKSDEGCDCRKPRPGMLVRAAADFGIDLARSVFIGDSETDVLAARAAGCEPVLFGPGISQSGTSMDWTTGVAVAPTPESLYQVTVESLASLSTPVVARRRPLSA